MKANALSANNRKTPNFGWSSIAKLGGLLYFVSRQIPDYRADASYC
jgi:hypothetical protein